MNVNFADDARGAGVDRETHFREIGVCFAWFAAYRHRTKQGKYAMAIPSAHQNVEFLSSFQMAEGAFVTRIRDSIPPGVSIRLRGEVGGEVSPTERDYARCLQKFAGEVSDTRSILILRFLYQHEKYLSKDRRLFWKNYRSLFDSDPIKRQMIEFYFPRIDQVTLSRILGSCRFRTRPLAIASNR